MGPARTIAENLSEVQARIASAAERAGRSPGSVRLVAVGKGQPSEALEAAFAAGVREFGENYVQEAEVKPLLARPEVTAHLVGPLQRNKARRAVRLFRLIQTVDRPDLVRSLAAAGGVEPVEVLIEVDLSGLPGRAGVPPGGFQRLTECVLAESRLRLQGVMAVAPNPAGLDPSGRERAAREAFGRARELFHSLPPANRQVLSMGMTGDFEAAIQEGSTMVRIGTAIFGPRRHGSAGRSEG